MERVCDGVYAGYIGEMEIPQDKREELNERVFQMLHQGGMMQMETVSLWDREIHLLKTLRYDDEGFLKFCYNYFGDSFREEAGYDRNTCSLLVGDVGFGEFRRVICAVYVLLEFYTASFGLAQLNGKLFDAGFHIGWINALFGERYTNRRATDPWGIAELFHRYGRTLEEDWEVFLDEREVSYPSLARYCYVVKGTEAFLELWEKRNGEFCGLVRKLEAELERLMADCGKNSEERGSIRAAEAGEDWTALLLHSLELDPEERMAFLDKVSCGSLVIPFLLLPPEFLVKAIAQAAGADFWALWEQWKPGVTYVKTLGEEPLPNHVPFLPVRTADFLCLPMYQTVKVGGTALDEDGFHMTDDDRIFYWKAEGDVVFSEEMKMQILQWKEEYTRIRDAGLSSLSGDAWMQRLVALLAEAEQSGQRLYAFQEMFYEFLGNSQKEEYQAAIHLLERLYDRYCGKGMKLGKKNRKDISWESLSRKVTFYPGRVLFKRYLALLANRDLRRNVFGF